MTRLRDLVSRPVKSGVRLPLWVDRILSVGIVSTDPDVVRRQRCVNVAALATVGNTISHLVMLALHNFRGLLVLNIYNVFMIVLPLLLPRLHRYGEDVGAVALAFLVLCGHTFVVFCLGTSSDLQVYYTIFPSGILLLLGVQHWRGFLVFFLVCLVVLLLALTLMPVEGWLIPEDDKLRDALSSQAYVNAMVINAVMVFYALTALHRADQLNLALIETMMPRPIAERLKSGEDHIADRVEMLTVMFADLVGFTQAAHALAPEDVVDFLDRLVRGCDALSQRYGVDKIKTIGDNYMAAAGFSGCPMKGAAAVGRLALAMMELIGEQPPLGGHKLRMRIGIHCGPATAGVIGDTRFSYDIWGDAVNTASRMESHSEPGRIHVSEAFRRLAADRFEFEERGATDIKSLGATRTFFLVAPRENA